MSLSIISTKQTNCMDCYRCLRGCPVKAISFQNHQAKVNEERCILCGRCVVLCPQKAKIVRNKIYEIYDYSQKNEEMVLSLAPSFPAAFSENMPTLLGSLSQIGIETVEETAIGASLTSKVYSEILQKQPDKTWLSSCCPVIVNLVEKYFPDLCQNLMPIISPMTAHNRLIKKKYGQGIRTVFAGPCIAKLKEAEEMGVDVACTFSQLKEALAEMPPKEVNLSKKDIEGSYYLADQPKLNTRLYSIQQGVVFTINGRMEPNESYWSVDGLEECFNVLKALAADEIRPRFIELMACKGGCIGGPAIDSPYSLFKRKERVLEYHKNSSMDNPEFNNHSQPVLPEQDLFRQFSDKQVKRAQFTEDEITAVLRRMGKYTMADERNCEGCGYNTCRDKVVAILEGMAIPEMCVPYMRAKAESFASTIVQSTPNAIILLDDSMQVLEYNPAAQHLFSNIPFKKGLVLSDYMNTHNLTQVLRTGQAARELKVYYPQWGLVTRQIITRLEDKDHVMAIISDITQAEENELEVQKMKEDIMIKAHEVINRQMSVAQTIAGLLGETTADTKTTLLELLKHLKGGKP